MSQGLHSLDPSLANILPPPQNRKKWKRIPLRPQFNEALKCLVKKIRSTVKEAFFAAKVFLILIKFYEA